MLPESVLYILFCFTPLLISVSFDRRVKGRRGGRGRGPGEGEREWCLLCDCNFFLDILIYNEHCMQW